MAQLGDVCDRCQRQIKGAKRSGSDLLIGELQGNEDRSVVTTGDVSERCHTADEARTKEWQRSKFGVAAASNKFW